MFQAVNFKCAEAAASDHTLDLFVGVLRNERHWLPCPAKQIFRHEPVLRRRAAEQPVHWYCR